MPCLNELAARIHADAVDRGWYDTEVTTADYLVSAQSELSEAWEAYRRDGDVQAWGSIPGDKPEGFPVEIADCLIRLLGMCHAYEIDIDEVVKTKMTYNRTRTYRHGGKFV